jgi:Glyoxalase-like domain
MALARFTKICLDTNDPETQGRFWAAALALRWEPAPNGEGGVYGPDSRPVLWLNKVPQPRHVKHRVHLDIYAAALEDLEALGATRVPDGAFARWTIMADPEQGEFCAFLRDEVPSPRLHGVVVDCTDPGALASFWVTVLGGEVETHPEGWSTADNVPGMTFTLDFVPVPEPKTVPNRVHWDMKAASVEPILAAGATLLREPDDEISWHILADPEGNEFCVMPES